MILTRHAESMLWVGRHLERAEMTSRWLNVASASAMHLTPEDAEVEWSQIVRALGLEDRFGKSHDCYEQRATCEFLLSDDENPGSVTWAITALRDNLRIARDRVPVELWEEVNRLHLRLAGVDVEHLLDSEPHEVYAMVREGCQAISGVVAESMMRDEGHAFIVVGRMLERSMLTVGLLRAGHARPGGEFDGDRLLRMTSALQAFRRLHGHDADPIDTSRFLLEADDIPRTVLSCLKRVESRLALLSADTDTLALPQRLVGRLRSRLEFGDIGDELRKSPLPALDELAIDLVALSDAISSQVFRPEAEPVMHAQFVRPGSAPT
ncbi:MAG: alpha-E domain-containing protein [Acidimicrobiia bacterium]|nr:alpha-E domain-containing protein [Acidimicrobiia bacterium]